MSGSHSRRDFLKTSAATAASLVVGGISSAQDFAPAAGTAKSCIFINLVGGPSHIDTFDPKPAAPSEVRGPFAPIQTTVPGLSFSELFPKLAGMADKFSLIRSMHHTAPPIHECGFQLLNTGRFFRDGPEWPSVGAVLTYLKKAAGEEAFYFVLPSLEVNTGVSISRGFGTAHLGFQPQCSPGEKWIEAARLSEHGNANVLINMYQTVFDSVSWDCHADGGSLSTNLNDIRVTVAPSFDSAFSRLLQYLEERGRLDSTLVVATGEFGRTPLLNSNGGRDHWAGVWTALIAGGGVKGGRVIGRTDAKGIEPTDRPVTPQELVATIFHAFGVPPHTTITGPTGSPVAVYPGKPVTELF